jgi:hypothetical protein
MADTYVVNDRGDVFRVIHEHGVNYWLERVADGSQILFPKSAVRPHEWTPQIGEVWKDANGDDQIVLGVLRDGSVITARPMAYEDGFPGDSKVPVARRTATELPTPRPRPRFPKPPPVVQPPTEPPGDPRPTVR